MRYFRNLSLVAMLVCLVGTACAGQTTLTIGTINNNDMIIMQELSKDFETKNPDIKLNWVVLEENTLRQRVTTDIATNSGQFDIMTIGVYEAVLWGQRNWLHPLSNFPASYEYEDLIPTVREALSYDGKQYALPFYAESQMLFYRKDLLEKAGLTMPESPTWDEVENIAAKLNDPANGMYGIVLRGKPGWGEATGQVTPMVYSYGGRWFDMDWKPQFDTPEFKQALTKYTDLIRKYGPPGSTSNGFNECLMVFASGKAAMWSDATIAAAFLADPEQSSVIGKVGYAEQPYGKFKKGRNYLWAWSLAVPSSSKNKDAAQKFILWATSPEYIRMVADSRGWGQVPAGTRESIYKNPEYIEAAPFAEMTYRMLMEAETQDPAQEPVPYTGNSAASIPELPSIGNFAGQKYAAVISGDKTVDEALKAVQAFTERTMRDAGYYDK
jgi:ABC-type sugar transport system, periplasmic component